MSQPHPVPDDVDLEACLFGGQAFTWWRSGDRIEGIAHNTRIRIDPETRTWRSTPERNVAFLPRYLGANRVQPDALREDPDLAPLAHALPGLRLLDQDPWEAFLAFLISPVNNVPRIQQTLARLCHRLGPTLEGATAIPTPEAIANTSEATLRELGLGFRAPRLQAAANKIHTGQLDLSTLQQEPLARAREELTRLDGVGPKVAECILCYALNFDNAYPVDRWVKRASEHILDEPLTAEKARQRWGQNASMAQQLLFHGARTGHIATLDPSPVATFDNWRTLVGTLG